MSSQQEKITTGAGLEVGDSPARPPSSPLHRDPGCSSSSKRVLLRPSLPPVVLPENPGTMIVAFSGGKDSLAMACALRECDVTFQSVFYDWLPGSHITTKIISMYGDWLGDLAVLAHPCLSQRLNNGVWESRETVRRVRDMHLAEYGYEAARSDLAHGAWLAVGVRSADSPSRRLAALKNQGIQVGRKVVWPIVDWRVAHCREIIAHHGLTLPPDYALFGRSFDGLGARYTAYLDKHDRDMLDDVFPMWRADVARRIYAKKG